MKYTRKIARRSNKSRKVAKRLPPPPLDIRVETATPAIKVGDMVITKKDPGLNGFYENEIGTIGKVIEIKKVLDTWAKIQVNGSLACIYWDIRYCEPVTEYKPTPATSNPVLENTMSHLFEILSHCDGDEAKMADALLESYTKIANGLATGLNIDHDRAYSVPLATLAAFQAAAVKYLKDTGYKAK